MRKLNLNGHLVLIYDSIDELPILNFNRYNKFLLIDSGIGADLEDIDMHIERVIQYMRTDTKLAVQELQNMRQAMYFITQQTSPKHLAFAALIIEIDGIPVNTASEDTLKELLDALNGTTNKEIIEILDDIKKKISYEFSMYFPELADSAEEKEVFELLKKRTLAVLDGIEYDIDTDNRLLEIDDALLSMAKPKPFIGKNSVEIEYNRSFEKSCLLISGKTGLVAKSMPTLQFYLALEQVKKENTPKHKSSHGK